MHVELRSITPEAESLIARCARVSHRSVGKGVEDDRLLIRKLIALGHESVLEHAVATFEISGISRACANQLTRHRLASFIQEPQRYVDSSALDLVRPPSFPKEDWGKAQALLQEAQKLYRSLLEKGVSKEDARFVLPVGIETRLAKSAQWEIREVARRM